MKDEKLIKKSLELHFDALVVDQHCDIQMDMVTRRGRLENKVLERHHFPKFNQGGIDFALMSTVPHFGYEAYPFFMNPTLSALELIDCGLMDAAESPNKVSIVTTSAEIREAKKKGKISFMLGIEGAEAIGTNLSVLRNFYRLGVRVMTITWHKRNMAADGSGEPSGSGLTKFGKELIQEMNRIKMVVDVSHISEAGFWDIMQCSETQ